MKLWKRTISMLLTVCLALALLPAAALATDKAEWNEPQVRRLTVSWDGETPVDLLEGQTTISMPAGSKPVFTVTFDNNDMLNQVFVTSTKDGEIKYLEAKLQGTQYITDGYFDPSDTNYIPGTIAVTYSKKAVKVDESGNIGGTDLDTLKNQLSSEGISCRNETTTSDGTVTAQVVLGDMFGTMGDVYFDAEVSEFMAGTGIDQGELNRWLGVYQNLSQLSSYDLNGANEKKFTLYLGDGKDFGDPDTYLVMVKDATSNKYTKTLLKKAAGKFGLGDISDSLANANVVTKKLLEYNAISKDTAALREEIEAHPTMTARERTEANAKIDALDKDKKLFLIGMTAVSLLTSPVGTPLMISALVAGYSSIADYFWEHRVGLIQGCDPVENAFPKETGHSGWIECAGGSIDKSGNYYISAENRASVTIKENVKIVLCVHGCNSVRVNMKKGAVLHIQDCEYREHDDGSVSGGIVTQISMQEEGDLTVEKCVIYGTNTPINSNNGKITINSGLIEGSNLSFINLNGDKGKIILNGGTVKTGFNINGGELIINGGTIAGNYRNGYRLTLKNSGKLTVNNGTIGIDIFLEKSNETRENTNTVTIKNGLITGQIWIDDCSEGKIDGGIIQGLLWIRPDSKLTINGGAIESLIRNAGNLIINGGVFDGGIDNIWADVGNSEAPNIAQLIVNGGTINGGIQDLENGQITINGGTIYGDNNGREGIHSEGNLNITGGQIFNGIYIQHSQLVITNGQVSGWSNGVYNLSGVTTLLIQKESDIIISGKSNAFKYTSGLGGGTVSVAADENYSDSVIYCSSANAQGVKMTIQEAAMIDYTQPYIRLVASSLFSGSMQAGTKQLSWEYSLPNRTVMLSGAISTGQSIYAASYDADGRQVSVQAVHDINAPIRVVSNAAYTKLFWVDNSGRPLCESAVIRH